MKSGAVESDRIKIEGRQSIHRRKMSKNSPLVNGADETLSYAADDESLVRQVNLAAAYHDHISCTKSPDPCKVEVGREPRINLPCETDHIYANCSDLKSRAFNLSALNSPSNNKDLSVENRRLREMVIVQLELIKELQAELVSKDRIIKSHKEESEALRERLERRERRMCLLRKKFRKSDEDSTDNISEVGSAVSDPNATNAVTPISNNYTNVTTSVNLVTRYFGRRSKTIPSRALKRRYLGPPKSLPSKKLVLKSISSTRSLSSASDVHEDELNKQQIVNDAKVSTSRDTEDVKKVHKKHSPRPKPIIRKSDYLTTNKAYFLPDNQAIPNLLNSSVTLIDVPSWRLKPVTSFYQMEGTENINDPVFQRRHLKCEQDERRRKRWDMQRLREQKASEKLKYKQSREAGNDSENGVQKKLSFYPDPRRIEYIEITDQLPVLAFGHLMPLFQPSEFSLSWSTGENPSVESVKVEPEGSASKPKKSRLSSGGPKVT